MAPWDPEVEGCFSADGRFVINETGFAWLTSLRQRNVRWKEVKKQIVAFLRSKGVDRDRLREETKRARKKLKPWLG